MAHAPVTRFRPLVLASLREVKGRLLFAALCTLGATAAELLKPWPLKIILDHVILAKPVPRALRALQGLLPAGKVPLLLEAAAGSVVIALLGRLFSYFQFFMTSCVGYRLLYALDRCLLTAQQSVALV